MPDGYKGFTASDYMGYLKDLQINSNLFLDIWVLDEVSKRKKVRRPDALAVKKQQYIKFNRDGSVYKFHCKTTPDKL